MSPGQGFVERRTAEFALRDGTRVRLRPVVPEDRERLVRGFERLSPDSRYRRFLQPMAHLTERQLEYLTVVDYVDHFAWVALAADRPEVPGLGVARYVRLAERPDAAEAAVAVADDYQGRGLGTLLLDALSAVALENGVRSFVAYVLADNRPVIAMLERIGARRAGVESGVVRFEADLPKRAEELSGSALHAVLRAVARGEAAGLQVPSAAGPRDPG